MGKHRGVTGELGGGEGVYYEEIIVLRGEERQANYLTLADKVICLLSVAFFGIVITMNYNDHSPPHFHVRYGNRKALVAIDTLGPIRVHLPPLVLGFVVEWAP